MRLHSATSAAEPPAVSVGGAGTTGGVTGGVAVAELLHAQPNAAAAPPTPPPPVVSVIASVALAGTVCVADPESQDRLVGPESLQAIRELTTPLITRLNVRDR